MSLRKSPLAPGSPLGIIMSMKDRILSLRSHVRPFRGERGWSQHELARRAGVSRAEVSAIENDRLVPSTSSALRLAGALERSVEDLFELPGRTKDATEPSWAWGPGARAGRFWEARVGSRTLLFPVEPTSLGEIPHDGVFHGGSLVRHGSDVGKSLVPERTLVIAGCDPAVGLLVSELARVEGVRVLPLTRASQNALALLESGLVHAAGLHWSEEAAKDANASVVARTLGNGFRLLHLARWQEGVALGAGVRARSTSALLKGTVRWVAREEGSGARRCLDRLLEGRRPIRTFRHLAFDHRGVALAIRGGWAEAGVAVRLAAEEAGLGFLEIQKEDYELCYRSSLHGDSVVAALRRALRGAGLKKLYGDLPGYGVGRMGEERAVA
jgi:molybdate-binding protein/transcriptional regulator with XRE-family HTH domain